MKQGQRRAGRVAAAAAGIFFFQAPAAGAAGATLEDLEGGGGLVESDYDMKILLDGVIARVETRQVLKNRDKTARVALYTFDLPARAAITSMAIELAGGHTARAVAIDAEAALTPIAGASGTRAAPDAGLLRRVVTATHAGGRDTYELRTAPIPAGQSLTVRLKWCAPLDFRDGRLKLQVPGRGGGLAREQVALRVVAPNGARGSRAIRAAGALLAARAGNRSKLYRFQAPVRGDLLIEAAPRVQERRPRPRFFAAPLSERLGVFALSALAPRNAASEPPAYERLVLVIDVSRSMGSEGLKAAAAIVDALLVGAGPAARVEAILFDRRARPVLGELRPNDREARSAIGRALTRPGLRNGSDLGAALETVARTIEAAGPATDQPVGEVERGADKPTLVALVTDDLTPTGLSEDGAMSRLGSAVLGEAKLMSVRLVPDRAPLPAGGGLVAALARRSGGRGFTVRHTEARVRGSQLLEELAAPPPLQRLELHAAGAKLAGIHLPPSLEAGEGFFAVGFYHGDLPEKVLLSGAGQGGDVELTARRQRGGFGEVAAPLLLSDAAPLDFVPAERRAEAERRSQIMAGDPELGAARRELAEAALSAGVAGTASSLVAVDVRDSFARDRMAMAKRHGTQHYRRVPTPPELAPDHVFRAPSLAAATGGGGAAFSRPTGELDRSIVRRLMRTYVVPKARACYKRSLRRAPKLAGSVVVVAELARGEVQHAHLEGRMVEGGRFERCLLGAAYSIAVPKVKLGDDPEAIGLARYPLRFQRRKSRTEVRLGDPRDPDDDASRRDPDDPLYGLPDPEER